jgi:hypothetical protein
MKIATATAATAIMIEIIVKELTLFSRLITSPFLIV